MLRTQPFYENWHGKSRRSEGTARQHPRRRSKNRHNIPKRSKDHQQKRHERKLCGQISRQRS
eukprot:12930750-Prorocentrum_lima.AAC.1